MAPAGLSRPGSANKRASRHVATAPVPGDGLTDIYFTNGASLPSLEKTSPRYWNRLYRNLGGFHFQDVTESAGVAGAGYSMGAAAADYDNDGLLDLFVVNYVQWSPESDTARRAGGLMNWAASKAVAQVHRLSPCSMLGGKPREELSDLLQVCVVHGATAYRRPTTPAGTFALLNEIR